jgi:hypothetical protein
VVPGINPVVPMSACLQGMILAVLMCADDLICISLKKFGWNVQHELAVTKLKLALAENVRMAYPDNTMVQCVFCDASYEYCSGIVTQIPVEQRHQPLGFVGHRFNGSQLKWAIADKEAFAIKDIL